MTEHFRKTPRMRNFDYGSENFYFITICTADKKCIFGDPGNLNVFGKIARDELKILSRRYDYICVDSFTVMPNHVHAVIQILRKTDDTKGIDAIVGLYKAGVSRRIRKMHPDLEVWQRSFHDHVIRNQLEYEKIWNYVTYNDQKWEKDCFFRAR